MGDPDSGLMIEEADEDDLDDAGMVDGDGQAGDEDDEDEMFSATDGLVGKLGELEHTVAFSQSIDDPLGLGRPTMRIGSRLFFGGPEVVQSISNALGALCLNQAGQDHLASHPSIIPALFSIFTLEAHLKVLLEKENAVSIESSIDELLITLHVHITLLSDVYSTAGYTHGRHAVGLLQNTTVDIIPDLGGTGTTQPDGQPPAESTPEMDKRRQRALRIGTLRNPDKAQKKQAASISATLADIMYKHLTEVTDGNPTFLYGYHTVMICSITFLLFDASQTNYHAVLLLQFRKVGGLDAVPDTCRRYTSTISRIFEVRAADRSESDQQERVHVFGRLKMALHLLYLMIIKPAIDPGQIAQYISKDKPENHLDFYQPHDFLVKMRLEILLLIRDIWQLAWLVLAPPAVSKDPVPEEPPAAVQPPAAVTTAQEPVANEAPADAPMETEPTIEERRRDWDEIRKSLISDIGPQALRLADAHPSLIFDVRHVFIGPNNKYRQEAIRCVVQDIEKFSPAAYDFRQGGKEYDGHAYALPLSQPIAHDKDQALPKWLPALLLAMESLFVTAEERRTVPMVLADQPIVIPPLVVGPPYAEARSMPFELCIRLLHIPSLPRDELLATLRMLVQLTRDRNMAVQFVRRNGVSLLLQRLKGPAGDASVAGFQSHVAIILRHLVEDRLVLKTVMKQEIKRWLSNFRSKLSKFLHMFVILHRWRLAVLKYSWTSRKNVALCPKSSAPPVSSRALEPVVHVLLGELMRVGKLASEGIAAESSKDRASATSSTAATAQSTSSECKFVLLTYPKKKTQTPAKDVFSRSKSPALSFFLTELLSFGPFNADPKFDSEKRVTYAIGRWVYKQIFQGDLGDLVAAILRPLEYLQEKSDPESRPSDDSDEDDEEDDDVMETERREETHRFILYAGEMEEHYDEEDEDEMNEDEDEGEDDVDVGYDEESVSEDSSNTEPEEGAEEHAIIDESPEGWVDMDEEMAEGMSDMNEDEDEDEGDDLEEEEGAAEEIMCQLPENAMGDPDSGLMFEEADEDDLDDAGMEAEEKVAKEAEEKAAREAEERATAEKEAAEKAATEREAVVRAAVSPEVAPDASTSGGCTDGEHVLVDEDTEMADAIAATESAQEAEAAIQAEPEAGPSTAPERVTITINGNEVDITDTDIDSTFLEALPDDMREEILNQHLREQRPTQAAALVESQVSAVFLDALPPEIRAEILREERLERSRREREQDGEGQTAVPTIGPTDMGPVDFIASLDPQLRQIVLLDSADGILQTHPSHMVAEAGVYRETAYLHHRSPRPAAPGDTTAPVTCRVPPPRDAIQLLERPGIAALVGLLIFPQLSKKSTLHKVLLYLCENSKSRTELFNVLLSILQDGTGDLALVDKSLSQLTFRGGKGITAHPTSKNIRKQKDTGLSIASPIVPSEVPPDRIVQRCLDALNYIVGTNELSSLFFLTGHGLPAGLKRSISKKGEEKEKQAAQSHYPIYALSIMDSVAGLLDSVTLPLTSLKDDLKKKEVTGERPSAPAESSAQQDSSGTAPPTTSHEPSSSADARDVDAQEVRLKANDFGTNLSKHLDELNDALSSAQAQGDLPPAIVAKFSQASSDRAKFLRVLKTIDYMCSKQENTSIRPPDLPQADRIREIYETFRFTMLWQKFSDCLTVVESRENVEHIATILLPLIESLIIVCKDVGVQSTSAPAVPGSLRSPLLSEEEFVDDLFVRFTDDHRKILNMMVRNNPSLTSGSFSLLIQNPRVLDFDNKRNYFSQRLHKRPYPREHYPSLQVNVRRLRVFEDSFHAFQHKTGDQIQYSKLSVRFYAEEGVDAGGVTREWFQILIRQMFNSNYALFRTFDGRVIGKDIYDGRLMGAHLARSLYRILFGKRVDYCDVEWVRITHPGQIAQYISKDKPENHPDFYEPHDFLVKMSTPGCQQICYSVCPRNSIGRERGSKARFWFGNIPEFWSGLLRPSQRPDEDRIRQLTVMGFPRAAAVRALPRTNNNVNFATEYLLTHPFEPVLEDPPAAPATNGAPADTADTSIETEAAPEEQPAQETAIKEDYESQKTVEERRQDLDEIRKSLVSDIGPQVLRLADAHPSLILGARHVLSDRTITPCARQRSQTLAKWLPALLLAMESLLVTAEEPRAVPMVLADQPVVIPLLVVGPPYIEMLVQLFRERNMADQFLQASNPTLQLSCGISTKIDRYWRRGHETGDKTLVVNIADCRSPHAIVAEAPPDSAATEKPLTEDSTSMQVDSPKSSSPPVSSEALESVVHFMFVQVRVPDVSEKENSNSCKGCILTNMPLMLAHHKLINNRHALSVKELVTRTEINKFVNNLVNLDRVHILAIIVEDTPSTPPTTSRNITQANRDSMCFFRDPSSSPSSPSLYHSPDLSITLDSPLQRGRGLQRNMCTSPFAPETRFCNDAEDEGDSDESWSDNDDFDPITVQNTNQNSSPSPQR
ncbi:uncharacterized protein FOMMEDRAFT_26162 [Fomitiporia mediterranea MF3/22]|uniref:uncharacterized protein n=1 Tax=Fomitiporia mediterranea (strain MF3/22) TaxID=694068 RepID=UPI0004408B00|nr:uncharacterized protein FOMMEDRAFT_26162 [Fomitiporia mediterranea MF3/22]EJD07045.1 hypothetical protein FOMMEDRAFT_26162 [Fomitiporia mediterranea MF3/22]